MAMPTTCKPLELSGWYELTDGTWGFYSWNLSDGLVSLDLVTTVGSPLDIGGPPPERLRALREVLEAGGDRQGAAWCTLALHGHSVAIAEAIAIDRRYREVEAARSRDIRAVAAAAHGVPLSAVQMVTAEVELARRSTEREIRRAIDAADATREIRTTLDAVERCPHGTMPRDAGAGHWSDWHRGHGCHLDPERGGGR